MKHEVIEHVWIPMRDGCRLSARLWLPAGLSGARAPAVLEYIPYRKRDGTRGRDEPMHGFFAENGFASIRVDMRGSGDSEGLMADEYLAQEQEDALDVIAWIAAQPWCSGAVGMMGKSWGGFNSLQVAACRPPALKAIITVYSTDDRFRDDIHYMGGCLLTDNLWWGSIMQAYQARPLDPAVVGEVWREDWLRRLDAMPFFPAVWMAHQTYDGYWRHGSVQETWSAIQCPVLVVGGWADSYTNAVPRLLEHLQVPRRGIIGPWGHIYPQDGAPGPAIGFLQEALRWWRHWLTGEDMGVMDDPMLRAYVNDAVPPSGSRPHQPGRWVAEAAWPSPAITSRDLHLGGLGELSDQPGPAAKLSIRSPLWHGTASGEWMATGCPGEMPIDQRVDDGAALLFETTPLTVPLEILGTPEIELCLAADAPVAQLVVRLCDVLPTGEVLRVSFQVLNLTHRNGHARPEPLVPGHFETVKVTLNACGHRFAPGHRIRVAVATSYWPLIWPAPSLASLTMNTDGSVLRLPCRQGGDAAVAMLPAVHGTDAPTTQVDPGRIARWSQIDHLTGECVYVTEGEGGLFGEGVLRFDEIDTTLSHSLRREFRVRPDDPLSACYQLTQRYEMGRDGWRTRTDTQTVMTAEAGSFTLTCKMTVQENGETVWSRDWSETVPRTLM
jgi:putative CocE/NonD family hydrolase